MNNEVSIKSLSCPNCGAPLNITKNTTDVVFCDICGTKSVISGLKVNSEILKKNDINSGTPLTGTPDIIHDIIFRFITDSENYPIDVLEKLEIVGEQKVVVPAYLYTVSAFATYTYEAGNERLQERVVTDASGRVVTKRSSYIEWTQMSSIANETRTVIVCGNNKYMNIINTFYQLMNPDKLTDIEYLVYPDETITESFDVPYASAFSQHVKPVIEKCVRENAKRLLQGKKYRNLTIGQPNVQKEYEARVSLGIYIVDCFYEGQYFTMYFNSDASAFLSTVKSPEDTERTKYVQHLKEDRQAIKSTIISDFFHGGFSQAKENRARQNDEKQQLQQRIDSIMYEPRRAKAAFKSRNCRFRGIYSHGNDSFVWNTSNPDVPITASPFKTNSYHNNQLFARYNSYKKNVADNFATENTSSVSASKGTASPFSTNRPAPIAGFVPIPSIFPEQKSAFVPKPNPISEPQPTVPKAESTSTLNSKKTIQPIKNNYDIEPDPVSDFNMNSVSKPAFVPSPSSVSGSKPTINSNPISGTNPKEKSAFEPKPDSILEPQPTTQKVEPTSTPNPKDSIQTVNKSLDNEPDPILDFDMDSASEPAFVPISSAASISAPIFKPVAEASSIQPLRQKQVINAKTPNKTLNGLQKAISVVGTLFGWIVSVGLFLILVLFTLMLILPTKTQNAGTNAFLIVSIIILLLQIITLNPVLVKRLPSVPFFDWIKQHRIVFTVLLIGVWILSIIILALALPTSDNTTQTTQVIEQTLEETATG